MAPAGLVISKLAVQATAADEVVNGLLCLKVSLPREVEGSRATRWALFSSTPPRLTSAPVIHPLPIDWHAKGKTRELETAQTLLSLSTTASHPSTSSSRGVTPYLDVSGVNGQVHVVMDGAAGRKRQSSGGSGSGPSTPSTGDRREYLIVLEIQVAIDGHRGGRSSATIPLPRCLDNVVRFQIANEDEGEVSIMTEPKLLPLPTGAFNPPTPSRLGHPHTSNGLRTDDEGWEDGEDLSDEDSPGWESEGDGGGSWLEGRFQSSESLRLEWSFAPSPSSSSPFLQITPIYDRLKPSIHLTYEAPLSDCDTLETIVPEGWGFSSLTIWADGLQGWTCIDSPSSSSSLCSSIAPSTPDPDIETEDSFATIRAPRRHPNALSRGSPQSCSSSSKASLLRQTIPEMKVEDFSFEMNQDSVLSDTTVAPTSYQTPNGKLSSSNGGKDVPGVKLQRPMAGRSFELDFHPSARGGEGVLRLDATLAPLSRTTLVAPGVPVQMPRIQYGEPTHCIISCPHATYDDTTTSEATLPAGDSKPYFNWSDQHGNLIPVKSSATIMGDVKIKVDLPWGSQTIAMDIPASRAGVVDFCIPRDMADVKVAKATSNGRQIPRSIFQTQDGTRVFFGGFESGRLDIVLEVQHGESSDVVLPLFEGGRGRVNVQVPSSLSDLKLSPTSNLKLINPTTYTYDLSSPSPPILSFQPTTTIVSPESPRRWGILSWTTLTHLFMLWLLLSMAQQVQRLRTEINWIADETRDLRMYNELSRLSSPIPPPTSPSPLGSKVEGGGVATHDQGCSSGVERKAWSGGVERSEKGPDVSTALGRVVFGRTGWDNFASHPTVRTLSNGLGWLWHTVVWLIIPPR